jgi:hypothetical protein
VARFVGVCSVVGGGVEWGYKTKANRVFRKLSKPIFDKVVFKLLFFSTKCWKQIFVEVKFDVLTSSLAVYLPIKYKHCFIVMIQRDPKRLLFLY